MGRPKKNPVPESQPEGRTTAQINDEYRSCALQLGHLLFQASALQRQADQVSAQMAKLTVENNSLKEASK